MRFQQGVCESPTREAISAIERVRVLLKQDEDLAVDGIHLAKGVL